MMRTRASCQESALPPTRIVEKSADCAHLCLFLTRPVRVRGIHCHLSTDTRDGARALLDVIIEPDGGPGPSWLHLTCFDPPRLLPTTPPPPANTRTVYSDVIVNSTSPKR